MLKEIETEILAESLLAIADLERKYKGEPMVTPYAPKKGAYLETEKCPLCIFASTDEIVDPRCNSLCPWGWLEDSLCMGGKGNRVYNLDPIPTRLLRIARWRDAIVEELATRRS